MCFTFLIITSLFEKHFNFERHSYKGYVMGFVDLVFRNYDRYYILDWKSNHLGDNISAYSSYNLDKAMSDANYHLQYFIYTISVCRYLRKIHKDFDYEKDFGGVFYVFVRGCRKGKDSGVFYYKPSWDSVREYL